MSFWEKKKKKKKNQQQKAGLLSIWTNTFESATFLWWSLSGDYRQSTVYLIL